MGIAHLALAIVTLPQQPPADVAPGIDRELARIRRAAIANVHYDLAFELDKGIESVTGAATVRFELGEPGDVTIDFDGEGLSDIRINGAAPPGLSVQNGHVVIPASLLRAGPNEFSAKLRSRVASTGTPLTRYRDTATGEDYFYTLVVPADAHRLFPCFDQPDLKATFDLRLSTPAGWRAVANGPAISQGTADGRFGVAFRTAQPLSTYLFAFAAGPFARIDRPDAEATIYVRPSRLDDVEINALFDMHRDALEWLEEYFGVDYPFGKLDIVLLPGFPYGGMEHAGAIFYREASLVFDHVPTQSERIRRSTLIYHEVSHQWFGNLVTMEWFDDLWLKEGFATFVGYTLLDVLEPGSNAWLRFHQRVKPRAYAIDGTRGTTPIFQELQNLADAKSAYGAIVYNKAPSVLRELHARLGAEVFRRGVQLFLQRHAFGNARWQDLAAAFDEASGASNKHWSDRWILSAGMPRVRVDWEVDESGVTTKLDVTQEGVQDATMRWPLALEVLAIGSDGEQARFVVELEGDRVPVSDLVGNAAPACILVNPKDVSYGLFVLDPRSADWVSQNVASLDELLLRATAMSALYNTLREAELDPRQYAATALTLLASEADPATHAWLLDTLDTTVGRYLPAPEAPQWRSRIAQTLIEQLVAGAPRRAVQSFRFLAKNGNDAASLEFVGGVLRGERDVAGLDLGKSDRFLAAAALLASGDASALEAEKRRFADVDCAKDVYLAEAAAADAVSKQRYFDSYDQLGEPPEQWMQDSLPFFHWPGQSAITLPFLQHALQRVEWVKKHRRIFFMPAWIDAFVNAHSSPDALSIVERFLRDNPELPPDIEAKILQSLDGLQRAVRIRETFG